MLIPSESFEMNNEAAKNLLSLITYKLIIRLHNKKMSLNFIVQE